MQELRISNCRLTPKITSELIEAIHKKCYLKQFELANAPLSEENVIRLSEYVMGSKHLDDLDLSHNDMQPQKMDILLSYLRDNKKLRELNIAHNNLIEGNSGNNLKHVLETEAKVIDHLVGFLTVNRKLVHLNLTVTNLSENALLKILPAIKKTKGLQGIHLSGNPGVTPKLKQAAILILRTKPLSECKKLILAKVLSAETMQELMKTFLRESVKIKQINSGKRILMNGATDDRFFDIETKLIFSRYLHHKQEIPGSGQW